MPRSADMGITLLTFVYRNGPTGTDVPQAQLNAHALQSKEKPKGPPEVGILSDDVTHGVLKSPDYKRAFYLFHRLFEAHFLPVQTTILIAASVVYNWLTEGAADVHGVNWIFTVCKHLQTAGFMEVAFYLFLYENYHEIALSIREKEMNDAGLAEGMNFSHRSLKKNYIDYIMVPLVAPIYGAIPGALAQISHFWTVDLVYTVSQKATRQRVKSVTAEVET